MRAENAEESGQLLSSWKEISAYLGRTIRTCQRLESSLGLPVHRLDGSPKAHVFAYKSELDAWLAQKVDEHGQGRKKRLRPALYGMAGLALVIAGTALATFVLRPGPDARSIAVLPFDDLNSAPGSAPLAAGITEDLTSALSAIRGLQVMGRTSASAAKEKKLDAHEAGRFLKIRNLIEGSVKASDGRSVVTARLLDARNGFERWTDSFEYPGEDYFSIVEKIARAVAEKLGVSLLADEEAALLKRPSTDTKAHELYLTGRYFLGRPSPEAPGLALRFFNEALDRDPKFALAKAGIAGVYMNMLTLLVAPADDVGPKAEAAAREALALEPDLAEAHAVNAWMQFVYRWDWGEAERSFRRALALKPGDAMTRAWYAHFLLSRKRFEEAKTEIERALASEPLMPVLYGFSMWIHMYSGETEEVLKEFRRVRQIAPDFSFAYFGAGLAYLIQGRLDESVEMFQKGCLFPGTRGWPEAGLVAAYLRKGDRGSAEDVYKKLLRESEKSGRLSPVHAAWAAAAMGDLDRGYALLEKAVRERDPSVLVLHITAEALVPQIAHEPRFLAILDQVGLPH
jgi:TolB-like protein/tetratricopeptide (TPR) repeat protein